jgi:hypothetical protein
VIVVLPQSVFLWSRLGSFLKTNVPALLARCFALAAIPVACASVLSLLVHRMVVIRQHHFSGLMAETLTFIAVYAALAYPLVLTAHDRQDFRRYLGNFLARGKRVPRRLARAAGFSSN